MKTEPMRVLVYKRTHVGDPDEAGQFGIRDCMGSVRSREFDAVIGVGGTSAEPKRKRIDGKITWIGIGPHKRPGPKRAPIVTFDRFQCWDADGPMLTKYAPTLAAHLYGRNVRVLMSFTAVEQAEVERILRLARRAEPSRALAESPPRRRVRTTKPGTAPSGC